MKVFVTGVAGQLGHDVMNELSKRGYEGIGSDIAPEYSGVQDGSAVTTMPYVSLDITDKEAVEKVLTEQKPDVVVHCAAGKVLFFFAALTVNELQQPRKTTSSPCRRRRRSNVSKASPF